MIFNAFTRYFKEELMRNLLLLTVGLIFVSTSAIAAMKAPTLYGKISKEYRYVKQDKKSTIGTQTMDQRSTTGVSDVSSSETRLGVKGLYEGSAVDFAYQLELGLRTESTDNGGAAAQDENIRIRLSNVTAKTAFGDVTFGRHFSAGSLEVLGFDPMAGTGLTAIELDNADITGAAGKTTSHNGLGYTYVGRDEGLTYKTPNIAGAQITVSSYNQDGDNQVDKINQRDNWISSMLTYDKKFGSLGVKLMLNYAMQNRDDEASKEEDSFYNAALALSCHDFTLSVVKGAYDEGEEDNGTIVAEVDNGVDKMLVGLKYKMGDMTFLGQYATATDENAGGTVLVPIEAKFTQMALGVGYDFNKHVNGKFLVAKYEAELPAATPTNDNEATSIIGHVTLKF